MKRRAYTLIEVLVAAGIFASVLLMAFTAIATINRLQRTARDARSFTTTAQNAWQTISLYAKYGRPIPATFTTPGGVTQQVGPTSCQTPLNYTFPSNQIVSVDISPEALLAVQVRGLSLDRPPSGVGGTAVWMAVRDSTGAAPTYRIFGFVAVKDPLDTSWNHQLIAVRYLVQNGSCTIDGPVVNLFSQTNAALQFNDGDPQTYPFVIAAANNGQASVNFSELNAGALSSWTALGQPWMLGMKLQFIRTDGTNQLLPIQSSVTIRPYQSSVSP